MYAYVGIFFSLKFRNIIEYLVSPSFQITKISIDQETGFDRVETMKVMYSNDGINWAGNEMITLNNADSYVHTITSPTEARHVRILVSTVCKIVGGAPTLQ